MKRQSTLTLFTLLASSLLFGQADGNLQIHFIDVGQGDSAALISPQGQVALFDAGKDLRARDCTKPVAYLDHLGVKQIDFLFISHYHYDHIGCVADVLEQFPLKSTAYDRGSKYPGVTYQLFESAVAGHETQAAKGTQIVLDAGSAHPVTITVEDLNGAGLTTSNENDLSLTALVSFDNFRAEIGGDLSGNNTDQYIDVETTVGPEVGRLDVYKVHHHCSSHSTNENWLRATSPQVGIISAGDDNEYGHPASDCLDRLHQASVKTFWTEKGAGSPNPQFDVVGGDVTVEVTPGADHFSVATQTGQVTSFPLTPTTGTSPAPPEDEPGNAGSNSSPANGLTFVWSKNSNVYHLANCKYVQFIRAENRMTSTTPPTGKKIHKKCPTPP